MAYYEKSVLYQTKFVYVAKGCIKYLFPLRLKWVPHKLFSFTESKIKGCQIKPYYEETLPYHPVQLFLV